jgi:hypothetical protein
MEMIILCIINNKYKYFIRYGQYKNHDWKKAYLSLQQ